MTILQRPRWFFPPSLVNTGGAAVLMAVVAVVLMAVIFPTANWVVVEFSQSADLFTSWQRMFVHNMGKHTDAEHPSFG